MADRSDPQPAKHDPRTQAVQAAAAAVNAHATAPDTVTLHAMQTSVQAAQNLGATLHDIRNARATA